MKVNYQSRRKVSPYEVSVNFHATLLYLSLSVNDTSQEALALKTLNKARDDQGHIVWLGDLYCIDWIELICQLIRFISIILSQVSSPIGLSYSCVFVVSFCHVERWSEIVSPNSRAQLNDSDIILIILNSKNNNDNSYSTFNAKLCYESKFYLKYWIIDPEINPELRKYTPS